MNEKATTNKARLEAAFPAMDAAFDHTVRTTLDGIVMKSRRPARLRAIASISLLIVLMVGAALALTGKINLYNFFNLDEEYESVQPEAWALTRTDVAAYSFAHVDVTIREVAWDGRVIRILYSVRDRAATQRYTDEQLNAFIETDDGYWRDAFSMPAADADGVSAYNGCDYLFVNGVRLSLTGSMGSRAGEENGEVLVALESDLIERIASENAPITLGDSFTVSLPIVMRRNADGTLARDENNAPINDTPTKLSFTVHNTNLAGVRRLALPEPVKTALGTLSVTDFTITPICVYVTAQFSLTNDDENLTGLAKLADEVGFMAMKGAGEDETFAALESYYGAEDVDLDYVDDENGNMRAVYTRQEGKTPCLEWFASYVTKDTYPEEFILSLGGLGEITVPNKDR